MIVYYVIDRWGRHVFERATLDEAKSNVKHLDELRPERGPHQVHRKHSGPTDPCAWCEAHPEGHWVVT